MGFNYNKNKFVELLYGTVFFNLFSVRELCDMVREARMIQMEKI